MIMKKYFVHIVFVLILLIIILNNASAYGSSGFSRRFAAVQEDQALSAQQFPRYMNYPAVQDTANQFGQASSAYNRAYAGQVLERVARYDEDLNVKGSKVRRIISSSVTEKFVGPQQTESLFSQNSNSFNIDKSITPTNPTIYDGGSLYRYNSIYNQKNYGRDSYTAPYYYSPLSNNAGYYTWRY